MPNRLKDASSPYLRQHQNNPVDWYPWGEEPFAIARAQDRPVLLSIGYSACHWCHVMAHESFEDPETAALMNALYVNIKVDREEHPDVDQVYQHALQLLSEQGGWPLTMFLLPTGEPFFGGTYFPPEDRFGRPSFRRVLRALHDAYRSRGSQVREQARRLVAALSSLEAPAGSEQDGGEVPPDLAARAASRLGSRMDPRYGGFSGAPKFPNASSLELILRGAARSRDPQDAAPALLTLQRMAEGGIYDQLGGGFCRYSTDAEWLVPHFEKMLYDNGQLLGLYAHALQIHRRAGRAQAAAQCEQVLRETLGWLEREMRDPAGGLYSALDADSEGVEGKYYVFRPEEVEAACGAEAAAVLCRCYDVRPGGNWHDPHGHGPAGASILHVVDVPRDEAEARLLAEARSRLLAARLRRVPPSTDDKVLSGWNGLALSGLSEAARVLGDVTFLEAAQRTADFLLGCMRTADGSLWRTWHRGVARLPGTLDDHAFVAEGLLRLAQASGELRYLTEAQQLMEQAVARFYDAAQRTFYLADEDSDGVVLPVRPRSLHDSAMPSGMSVACRTLLQLAELVPAEEGRRYREVAEQALRPHAGSALRHLFGLSGLCAAVDLLQHGLTVIVIVYPSGQQEAAERLRAAAHAVYVPDPWVIVAPEGADLPPGLGKWVAGKVPQGGRATAYVCHGMRCSAPVTEPAALSDLLAAT
ncbi:MAG: thioredoxin domain-containing protein [Myxococcales bacterium]|nr:thioredoxin domain-containing protein [Myxococcota bacterium]MDW8280759.1 thioredoxin domain-containing protein [Myxococcales bacterium]